jgi:hypothetical protein
MRILSIDVGINNLSYCILEKIDNEVNILNGYWNNLSLINDTNLLNLKCSGKKKNGIICGKKCKFFRNINVNDELLGYCLSHKDTLCNEIKINKTKTLTTNELNHKLIKKLDTIAELQNVDTVIIEQQPSKNPTMKNLSFMIHSYFCIRSIDANKKTKVMFVSPKNKLKNYTETKITDYKDRKKKSIEITKDLIKDTNMKDFFDNHFKKDDLADCYLQGLWFLTK